MVEPHPKSYFGEKYHKLLLGLLPQYPHLEALLLYAAAIEKAKETDERGSHDSDSLLAAEVAHDGTISFNSINIYNPEHVKAHEEVLSGTGSPHLVKARLLLVEDVSPGAIAALGTGFNLNPHVFYFHLGFDTRVSAMQALVEPTSKGRVPVTWYFPNHGPEDFLSIPLQCDLSPAVDAGEDPLDKTYCRQSYHPISQVTSENQPAVKRGFHRISVAFAQTQIKTTIILAFPTWRRISSDGTGQILDSLGYTLVPPSMPLQVVADAAPKSKIAAEERKGDWSNGQWERVQPLFQALLSDRTWSIADHDFIRERILLWLYSKVSFNYHLASQNDSRCWRDVRALQASGRITGDRAQNAKKFLRDSMEKHTELLQIAKMTLDQALEGAVHQDELAIWQKKVEVVILYQKSRIDMILKNINEGRNS